MNSTDQKSLEEAALIREEISREKAKADVLRLKIKEIVSMADYGLNYRGQAREQQWRETLLNIIKYSNDALCTRDIVSSCIMARPDETQLPEGNSFVAPDVVRDILERVHRMQFTVGPIPQAFKRWETENPHEIPGAHDPNCIFHALQHLRMRNEYTLDYVWWGNGHEGVPLVYARPTDEEPLRFVKQFEKRYNVEIKGFAPNFPTAYLPAVECQDSDRGLIEFAVFLNEVNYFYWVWHARYERVDLAAVPGEIGGLDTVDAEGKSRWLSTFEGAKIRRERDRSTVSLLAHQDNVGLMVRSWQIRPPNSVLDIQNEIVASPTMRVFY